MAKYFRLIGRNPLVKHGYLLQTGQVATRGVNTDDIEVSTIKGRRDVTFRTSFGRGEPGEDLKFNLSKSLQYEPNAGWRLQCGEGETPESVEDWQDWIGNEN